MFQTEQIKVELDADNIAHLIFAAPGSVNKFDQPTLAALDEAITAISNHQQVRGVIVRSSKSAFIVGADITEFLGIFARPTEEIHTWLRQAQDIFSRFEDLPVPTIAAINGFALGGGCEMTLACDLRVAEEQAQLGQPEVKLGIMPGFGGSVRLPRLIGTDLALDWMCVGRNRKAPDALKEGAIDAMCSADQLLPVATQMLQDAIAGKLDWQARRAAKTSALRLNRNESAMCFNTAKGMAAKNAGKHYASPHTIIAAVEEAANCARDEAMVIEAKHFVTLTQLDSTKALTGIFLADQAVKGRAKKMAKTANKAVQTQAVLGAGIMGGGIAYQGAVKGIRSIMKDINEPALELGLNEAASILNKGLQRGKVNAQKMAATLNNIVPTLEYSAIKDVELVVEAVVENPKVKSMVLAETEQHVAADAVITSNTSTISINQLAKSLQDPSRFCGMHFFNPVHRMPLVEIIRGEKTSEETIGTVVATALQMGKVPVVVNDCPGFLVNRVLFPYFAGFSKLILDGADFVTVDKVMEKQFGWPMGPAYLLDVVGMDTADHAAAVMAEGFPSRMQQINGDPVTTLYKANRLGQKNGQGFYDFSKDKRGRPVKTAAQEAYQLLEAQSAPRAEFSAEEIITRLMIPMANEAIRCLEEGIIDAPADADIALLNGLGFPPFRGGIFRYIDTLGLENFVELADKYAHLGEYYQVTEQTRQMAKDHKTFY